jgi:hypothetical protein
LKAKTPPSLATSQYPLPSSVEASAEPSVLKRADVIVVCVPTPLHAGSPTCHTSKGLARPSPNMPGQERL